MHSPTAPTTADSALRSSDERGGLRASRGAHRTQRLPCVLARLARLALLVGLCGCEGGGGAGLDGAVGPRVELGTGTSSFVPIPASGGSLELVAGPQGGHHVNLTARLYELDVSELRIAYDATPVGASSAISLPTELILDEARVVREGDHLLRAGDFLVLNISGPDEVVGMELEIRARVTEASGRFAEDARTVRIVDELTER